MEEKALCKTLWRFGQTLRSDKVTKHQFGVSKVMPANLQSSLLRFFLHLFVSFMEKKPPMKFYGVLDLFP